MGAGPRRSRRHGRDQAEAANDLIHPSETIGVGHYLAVSAEAESGTGRQKAGRVRYWQYGQAGRRKAGGKRDGSAIGNMGKHKSRLT